MYTSTRYQVASSHGPYQRHSIGQASVASTPTSSAMRTAAGPLPLLIAFCRADLIPLGSPCQRPSGGSLLLGRLPAGGRVCMQALVHKRCACLSGLPACHCQTIRHHFVLWLTQACWLCTHMQMDSCICTQLLPGAHLAACPPGLLLLGARWSASG
jgi:hypothetical protein